MLTELGMCGDLTEDFLVKVAEDIEESAGIKNKTSPRGTGSRFQVGERDGVYEEGSGSNGEISKGIQDEKNSASALLIVARESGRRLLRYLKQAESGSDLFKSRLCQKLRVISFVPVQKPVSVEQGGHIVYLPSLSSFDELLALSASPLGFSVMSILDEDIAPPLIFFSSLGVTTSPAIEVVLRHLRNLTANCGDSLDRWNNQIHSIRDTFSALFQHLLDHWKSIVPPVQEAIRSSQIVPVGHFLVRPARLFFRLQGEDLSPFMHEVPRYFGAHEQFLKELGVKEEPSASDYVEVIFFLTLS